MRVLVLLALAACSTPEEDVLGAAPALQEIATSAAEDPTVSLRAPLILGVDPLIAGQPATLRVDSLAPGETTYLAYSLYGTGNGVCPPAMGGVCLNLLNPVQLLTTAQADATGVATVNVVVPAGAAPGTSVSLQAVAIRGIGGTQTVKSPAITEVVQAAGGSDVFQHVPAAVDLLFVIDDSCSMGDEQQRLVSSFVPVMQTLAGYDLSYHVGVVTTDMNDPNKQGKLQPDVSGARFIDDATPQPATSFAQMASVGVLGYGLERGLDSVYASLNVQQATNAGFRRLDAQYAVVVLSDEEDYSQISVAGAANTVLAQESHPGDATFTSIVGMTCYYGCYNVGTRYMDVTGRVGGELEDIAVLNYAPVLDLLASTWWTSEPYVLSAVPPNPAAITVAVDGQPVVAGDFVYDASENTVRFTNGYAPLAGARVEVTY